MAGDGKVMPGYDVAKLFLLATASVSEGSGVVLFGAGSASIRVLSSYIVPSSGSSGSSGGSSIVQQKSGCPAAPIGL